MDLKYLYQLDMLQICRMLFFLLFQAKNDITKWCGWLYARPQSWTSNCGTKFPISMLPGYWHLILDRCRLMMHWQWGPWRKTNMISRHIKGVFILLVFWFQQTEESFWRKIPGNTAVCHFWWCGELERSFSMSMTDFCFRRKEKLVRKPTLSGQPFYMELWIGVD